MIDTSVVIDLPAIDLARLPLEVAISAITLAALAAGLPLYTRNQDNFVGLSDLLEMVSI